jgi:hypothetical protein
MAAVASIAGGWLASATRLVAVALVAAAVAGLAAVGLFVAVTGLADAVAGLAAVALVAAVTGLADAIAGLAAVGLVAAVAGLADAIAGLAAVTLVAAVAGLAAVAPVADACGGLNMLRVRVVVGACHKQRWQNDTRWSLVLVPSAIHIGDAQALVALQPSTFHAQGVRD